MGGKESDTAVPELDPSLHVARPTPLGLARASEVALFTAAPLLTAGALTLIGVVCADYDRFRWPGPALLFLVLTVIALLASIQLGYRARQRLYSYQELKDWFGTDRIEERFLDEQKNDYNEWFDKTHLASATYDCGTVLLCLSVAVVLLPDDGKDPLATWRWATAAVVLAATAVQTAVSINAYRHWWKKYRDTEKSKKRAKRVKKADSQAEGSTAE